MVSAKREKQPDPAGKEGKTMQTRIETAGTVVTAYLNGEIDHHTAASIREQIDEEIRRTRPELLILDFRDITFMDSSGIGLVMGRYREMQLIGGQVHVTNTSPQIRKVMRLAGMDRLAVFDRTPSSTKES